MRDLLRETFREWSDDQCLRLGAALAYYTIFSMAPLLVLVIGIAGLVFSEETARGEIVSQIEGLVGPEGAAVVASLVSQASEGRSGIVAAVVGLATMLLGASGVFAQLQGALNEIFDVPPRRGGGILQIVWNRVLSFSVVLVLGFVLLVSLVLSALIAGLDRFVAGLFPGTALLIEAANAFVSLGVITVLFAMIFKILPDVSMRWSDVWLGAAVTSVLFSVGKHAIGLYLGNTGAGSVYGAASSLVILLLWVYYASQILFLGAEFTQVYARRRGSLADGSTG